MSWLKDVILQNPVAFFQGGTLDCEDFCAFDFSVFRSRVLSQNIPPPGYMSPADKRDDATHSIDGMLYCDLICDDGTLCNFSATTPHAIRAHQMHHGCHSKHITLSSLVKEPICIWCSSTFRTIAAARQHVRHSFVSGICHADRALHKCGKEIPDGEYSCPICDDFTTTDIWWFNRHVRSHLPAPVLIDLSLSGNESRRWFQLPASFQAQEGTHREEERRRRRDRFRVASGNCSTFVQVLAVEHTRNQEVESNLDVHISDQDRVSVCHGGEGTGREVHVRCQGLQWPSRAQDTTVGDSFSDGVQCMAGFGEGKVDCHGETRGDACSGSGQVLSGSFSAGESQNGAGSFVSSCDDHQTIRQAQSSSGDWSSRASVVPLHAAHPPSDLSGGRLPDSCWDSSKGPVGASIARVYRSSFGRRVEAPVFTGNVSSSSSSVPVVSGNDHIQQAMAMMSRDRLVSLCREHGLPVSGSKQILINRLRASLHHLRPR